jgi:HKD family nuclease
VKTSGLESRRWVEGIADFVRQYGRATPRWAVFFTYELTLDKLARSVLPVLAHRGRQFRSVVLADQGALEGSLALFSGKLAGSVNLHPVRCKRGGVFHPKLVLLRAGKHVRACFGSANITDGGLGTNLELWTETESAETLAGLQRFIRQVADSKDLALDAGARRNIARALCGLRQVETPSVWSSLDEPFSSRLRKGPERLAKRATVLSPMYASPGGIRAARKAIPAPNVQLFTDAGLPVPASTVFVYDPPHPADQEESDADSFPQTLHAKAYVFHSPGRGDALAWMGSANFTKQALTKTVAKGGNVELMVQTTLPADEVDTLGDDLKTLFTKQTATEAPAKRDMTPPRPMSTILACELADKRGSHQLIVYTSFPAGHVTLEYEKRQLVVAIKASRGVATGPALARFLPQLDLSAAQVLVIYQRIGKDTVPVVVNVPHVPSDSDGANAHSSIDALIDDLLGRVRVPDTSASSDEDPEGDPKGDEDAFSDDVVGEVERRLDEVRHQGELDQLAVKAAMLKKLATRTAAAGFERDEVVTEILRVILAPCPQHLQASIRRLFEKSNTKERA